MSPYAAAPLRAVVLLGAALAALSAGSPGGAPDGRVLVSDERGAPLFVIDAATDALEPPAAGRVPAVPDAGVPDGIAVSTDGALVYVARPAEHAVEIFDVKKRKARPHVLLPDFDRPEGLALTRDGRRLYVATGRGGRVLALDTRDGRVVFAAAVSGCPRGVALGTREKKIYVANGLAAEIAVLDAADGRLLKTIPTGTLPWGVAVESVR